MKVYGQIQRCQLENLSSDPSGSGNLPLGRIWFDTSLNVPKVYDGTSSKAFTLSGTIVNADIDSSAAIARSKLATGSLSHVVINDGSTGAFSSEATLSKSRGGAGADMSSVTFPSTGTIATVAGTEQFTNKDIDGGTASNTSRITVPKNSTSSLNALTRKAGTVVFDTTTTQLKYDDGSSLVAIGTLTASADSVGVAMTSTGANAVAASRTRSTGTSVSAGGVAISSSCGAFSTTNSTATDVTNLSVTITTSGRPVFVGLVADGTSTGPASNDAGIAVVNTTTSTDCYAQADFMIVRGSTVLSNQLLYVQANGSVGGVQTCAPGTIVSHVDTTASASTYTYKVQVALIHGSAVGVTRLKLVAYEL